MISLHRLLFCFVLQISQMSTVDNSSTLSPKNTTELEKEYATEIQDVWDSYEYRKKRKQCKVGVVISTKCMKTINVEYAFRKFFPKYNVYMTRHRRLQAHDETEQAQVGDVVRIVPCRPRSRTKRHELIDIVRRPRTAQAITSPAPVAEQS
jgi:small subunit ribosomal protein S17